MERAGRRMGQRRRDAEGTSTPRLIFQVELASSVTMILYYFDRYLVLFIVLSLLSLRLSSDFTCLVCVLEYDLLLSVIVCLHFHR